ncbi:MAG: putative transporter permease protein, partial [Steroidobacteraceae bacterium]|nr:putative transporter permease protein [Steroidobacteraceae bacterium]
MNVGASIRVALRALSANKLRGILTMLGVIIGVAAVIALMSLGKGAQAQITDQVQSLGSNLVFVTPGQGRQQGNARQAAGNAQTLSVEDARAISSELGSGLVKGVAAERFGQAQLIAGGQNVQTRLLGVTPEWESVRNFHPASGDFITSTHIDSRARVIVLGASVAQNLFGDSDAIGQTVRVSAFGRTGLNARVIGVMESKGGGSFQNLDDQAFLPFSTLTTSLFRARTPQAAEQVGTIT